MTQVAEKTDDGVESSQLPPPSLGYRVIRGTGLTLVWLGVLTIGFVAHQLWITTFFAIQNQADLAVELEEHFAVAEISEVPYVPVVPPGEDPPSVNPTIVDGASGSPRLLKAEAAPPEGAAFAEIRIPKLDSLADGSSEPAEGSDLVFVCRKGRISLLHMCAVSLFRDYELAIRWQWWLSMRPATPADPR